MNTAAMTLKKIDLLNFISQSDAPGASLRMTATSDGSHAGVISFPSCGNWTNKPVQYTPRRVGATAMLRVLGAQ